MDVCLLFYSLTFVTARRYASAVYVVALYVYVNASVCLSVCLSQVGKIRKQRRTVARDSLVIPMGASCETSYQSLHL